MQVQTIFKKMEDFGDSSGENIEKCIYFQAA